MGQKKVLYFAENAISPIQGGGIVVKAALDGLAPENLLGFYTYRNITPSPEFAPRFHLLPILGTGSPSSQDLPRPLTLVAGADPGGIISQLRTLGKRAATVATQVLLPWLGSDQHYVDRLVAEDGFQPDLVYFSGLSLRTLRLAVDTAVTLKKPLVMLNMDDWMAEESSCYGPMAGFWEQRIADTMKVAKPLVAYAYSNSPHLARRLSERYGIPHDAVNNASPDLLKGRPVWSPPPKRSGLLLTFAGAMNWHLQGQTLVRLAEAVVEIRTSSPVELRIFAPWEFAPLANQISVPGAVTYCGFRSPSDLVDAYLESDLLVATTTFKEKDIRLFRYSLATKLSDYLCVGRPVLAVGHPDWALNDYVDAHACGITVRTPDRNQVKAAIQRALAMPAEERERIGRANRQLWEQAHDVRVMAKRLREILGLPTD
jgi:glycosyltransferase involved in cell wall biosynthesis